MKVLVDTSVWSLALRRSETDRHPADALAVKKLSELIREGLVTIIGPIRQELLSGIADDAKFRELMDKLRAFEDLPLTAEDHERAAEFFNSCRKKGIQGSHTDFLICSIAMRYDLRVFTLDKDFERFAKALGVGLFS